MILTRSDYRRHYRENNLMMDFVRWVIECWHTLFLGFSHKEPEVSRFLEDVIWTSTKSSSHVPPGVYSLQFDMLQRTPEIFAARGIVALQPPFILPASSGEDTRTLALSQGLIDLLDQAENRVDNMLWLSDTLDSVRSAISNEFERILNLLKRYRDEALLVVCENKRENGMSLCRRVAIELETYANQGVYLVNRKDEIFAIHCNTGLNETERKKYNFSTRPYFRQANSLRKPFISDAFESIFNGNISLSFCLPLAKNGQFSGLLFSAYNVRDKSVFETVRTIAVRKGLELVIVDANGILVYPSSPHITEGEPVGSKFKQMDEKEDVNIGLSFWNMVRISRTDRRIQRIIENVVPLSQDDDFERLGPDTISYAVVSEIPHTRMKIAVLRYLRLKTA